MQRIEVKVLVFIVLVFLAIVLYTGIRIITETVKQAKEVTPETTNVIESKIVPVTIASKQFLLEIADTPEARQSGLSGRTSLCHNCGMLFVFENPGKYSIWMKDMDFPIDVFWIDEDKKVVHIVKDMSPASYPQTFEPGSATKYIIEVPSGSDATLGVEKGSSVEFDLSN